MKPMRKRPARRAYRYLEADEQRLFVKRFRLDPRTRQHLACAVPNGGRRNVIEATRLKAEGVTRGVPDWLCFAKGRDGAIGLAIEFKSPTGRGRLSVEQRQWIEGLGSLGWRVVVATSAADAWRSTLRHLGVPLTPGDL